MIGDFGARNVRDLGKELSSEFTDMWKKAARQRQSLAASTLERAGQTVETRKVLVLVDLNGIYLRLHGWLAAAGVPMRDGLILSRFAFFQVHDTFQRIKAHILATEDDRFRDLDEVTEAMERRGDGRFEFEPGKIYLRFEPSFDLFYAPAPYKDIEWKLKKEARSGSLGLKRLIQMAEKGVIEVYGTERDYGAYDDFIAKLKANPEYAKSERGFFCYNVGPRGLRYFGEKEVDTRIVIRAMETFFNYEADALCVASSDQDFLPLAEKAADFGIDFYQADLAKFENQGNIGRKIRELGGRFLTGRIGEEWPLRIVLEAVSSPDHGTRALYELYEDELEALCRLHNEKNDYKIAPSFDGNGNVSGLTLSKSPL